MSLRQRTILILAGVLILSALAGVFVYPLGFGFNHSPWHLGLDLVGGSSLIYEVDMKNVPAEDRDATLSGLRDVMERRVNAFGVSEPQVFTAKEGLSYRIVVDLAGVKDTKQAIDQIGKTALLNFREVQGEGTSTAFVATDLTGKYLTSARVGTDPQTGVPVINITFNGDGAKLFEDLTAKNIGKPLAIFLDGDLISSPTVQQKIAGGNAVITGQFTLDGAQQIVSLFNAGALPAPVSLISQQTVSASLGTDSLKHAIYAGIVGTLAIILFMLIYYRSFGVWAGVALCIYICLTLGIFKLFGVTMTLSGIAGFILSIGMAVDANILIFERTREELARGLQRTSAIEEGFKRAWTSIRDSNISTIITAVILYYYTSSFVRGFALTLLLGVLLSMFSAITVTRTLLRAFVKNSKPMDIRTSNS